MQVLKNISFLSICLIISFSGAFAQNVYDQQFEKYDIINLDPQSISIQVKANDNGPITVQLDKYTIELVRTDMISDDYISIIGSGVTVVDPERAIPMNGYTSKGGRVSLTLGNDLIYGFIVDGEETLFIEPATYYDPNANKSSFITYWESDVKNDTPKTCGVTELQNKMKEINPGPAMMVSGLCYEVQYAICNDYSMVDKYGSAAGAENHAIGVTNNVNTLYDTEFPDEIIFIIEGQYNSTCAACDPWTASTDPQVLLPDFRTWALSNLSITHDVASLWTDRDFDGTTIGLAYIGVVCNSYRYNVLQDWSSNATLKKVMVTHELGHNFGSGHDAVGTFFVMSPAVNNTTAWSGPSISVIESYYSGISCLGSCTPQQASIEFQEATASVSEQAATGSGGLCGETFQLIDVNVSMNTSPTTNVNITVAANGSSTATANKDYEILNTTLTFTPSGSLTQAIQVRVIDDKIEEVTENLILDLTINSGNVVAGQNMSHTLDITSALDVVNATCCSGGGEITYGNHNYSAATILNGDYQDEKSRTIILASELVQAGLTAGLINSLSFNVVTKGSTGMFKDFRVGLASTANSTLDGLAWLSTTQNYLGDLTTTTGWNDFAFSTPFLWDGVSNVYIQFCFNNITAVGQDVMQHTIPTFATGRMIEIQATDNSDGCSSGDISGTAYFTIPIQPRLKFGQSGGALVEIQQNISSTTHLSVGETAHFYTTNDKVIASITNTGNIDLGCVTAKIHTAGSSKLNATFGVGDRTQKTFNFTGNSNATSEVTLYFTDAELSTWGSNQLNLNMVQSNVPIASSTDLDVTLVTPTTVSSNMGAGNQISYTGAFIGSGYFALTDVVEELVIGDIDVDFVINQGGSGILLTNDNGQSYRLSVTNSGILTSSATSGTPKACMAVGDLFVSTLAKGVILRQFDGGYTKLTVSTTGGIITTNMSSIPSQHVLLSNGDFELEEFGSGIILKSSNGQCYRIYINNTGSILTELVNCP